jgi:hypothetical protein
VVSSTKFDKRIVVPMGSDNNEMRLNFSLLEGGVNVVGLEKKFTRGFFLGNSTNFEG